MLGIISYTILDDFECSKSVRPPSFPPSPQRFFTMRAHWAHSCAHLVTRAPIIVMAQPLVRPFAKNPENKLMDGAPKKTPEPENELDKAGPHLTPMELNAAWRVGGACGLS